ncbi:hypothetical protein [Turneriella parva]|uniref:Uncharacterized protein n=1 Tax=Turneriella parva (strain ATCC BAA-1111 / DSM 21527 / NCTC 11395 / H) TaxID=869212 RepID=I4BBA1_TURPD|nr:hypothetical protein [Turneriella parva]AFM14558.1 hypothetical protein Turpa_3924 [Turneriella parva DSM 21527]
MNWQKLKDSVISVPARIEAKINQTIRYLRNPLILFRFLAILLVLDFVAFMSLTRSSYAMMLNPVAFLFTDPIESRSSIELYFPRSLSLTGIEKIYPEDEAPEKTTDAKPKLDSAGERPLSDAAVAEETVLTRKQVQKPMSAVGGLELSAAEAMARRVMLELIAGPAGEVETLKARNLLKESMFLRSLWTYQGTVYISTDKMIWDKMTPNERKITEFCIVESLRKNLGSEKFALLKE